MIFIVLKPQIAPSKPTATTTAAVSDGIPPIALVTSMAIGVVTDFGASERITSCEAPMSLAISTTEITPTIHPASWDRRIGKSCFFIISN